MLPRPDFPKRTPPVGQALRILLLEDDPVSVEIVGAYLRRIAFADSELHRTASLADALGLLAKVEVDLVIADLNLPDSTGPATVAGLVQAAACPVIAITSDRDPGLRAATLARGAYDFVHKSDLTEAVLQRLVRLAAMQARTFRSLRESEALKSAILDASMDAVVTMDHRGRIVEFNAAAERQFGHARDSAIGRELAEVIVPPELREAHRKGLARFNATNHGPVIGSRIEIQALRSDGSRFDAELAIVRIPGTEPALFTGTLRDITQRKWGDAALRESEARFRSLSALSSDWFWETDAEHRFITKPTGVTAVTGFGEPAYVGKSRWEVAGLAPLSGDWSDHRQELERHASFCDLELVQVRADGSRCYLQISGEPVYHPDGSFKGYRGTAKDITARIQGERLLALEHAVARRLATAESAPQAIRELMQAVCETEGWGCGRFFALDPAAEVMRFEEAWAKPGGRFDAFIAGSRDLAYTRGTGLVGKVWESPDPLWIKDASSDPRVAYSSLAREHGMHSALVFPVSAGGRTVGVISVSSEAIREPDSRLLGTLRLIGNQLGHFMQRCGAEAALRASEERFRQTFELAGSGMAHVSLEGRFLRVNRSLCRILRYPERELVGRWVKDISHPDDRDAIDAARQQVRAGIVDYMRAQKRYLRKDGATVWIDLTVALARDGAGEPLYEIGVLEDITERKDAESALRESEARFRSLTELTTDWYWEQDENLRFIKFETADGDSPLLADLGLRRWESEGVDPSAPYWAAHIAQLERRERFHDFEYSVQHADGRREYFRTSGYPVLDSASGFRGYRGVARNITEARRGEEDLHRFRAALDAAGDMVFLVDARTSTYLDFNQTACRTLGYGRDEMLGMDAHRVRVDRTHEQLLDDYRALNEASAISIGTYRRKDGSEFPVEVTRRMLQTRGGAVIVVTARDLTERMQAEQRQAALLRRQQRIARFGQSALAGREPGALVDEAVQTVLEALGADGVAYVERGPAGHDLVLRTMVGMAAAPATSSAINCPSGHPLLEVLQSGGRRVVSGAGLPFFWAQGMGSAALIAVHGERGARGVLCVLFRRAETAATEELNFVDAVASVLSTGLQRIDSEGRLAYLAQFDALTGLPNRALLADRSAQLIAQATRHRLPLAVLFIDLDEFKMVNDTLGHAGGDALLREVAARLRATVRPGDTVARISGDEFAIVLADLARPEDAAVVAQKVIDRLAAAVDVGGKEVFVTASVGIAAFPADGADAESLIGAADAAMYRAKQSGRNAFHFFTAEINQRSRARSQLSGELRRALERDEFALVYQPKMDLNTRRAIGGEALLRWKHPQRGLVSPMEFIPILEETGLIVPVGDWVLRRACDDLKAWQAAGHALVPIAVNLSARQFRQTDLDSHIKSLLASAAIDPGLIELEITESQLMHDPEHAIRVMRALRGAGMRIAIDDFGTGYSSLAYLRRFPVSALKIDRSFIKDMAKGRDDATIVRTIIEMAHSLGFTVVAEGVETEEQATFLRLLRCEQAQGYLFAKPMPADEFVGLALDSRSAHGVSGKPGTA